MKLPFTAACGLLVLALTAPSAEARKYTPAEFQRAIIAAVGPRKGAPAYNKAATFLQAALRDPRNKPFATQFARSATIAIKGSIVPIPQRGRAVNTLVKGLIAGYFQGRAFNLRDPLFNRALGMILRTLPLSQKTATVSQLIYNTLKTYSARRGISRDDVYAYYQSIHLRYRLPDPPHS
jgi:hypothetical protein